MSIIAYFITGIMFGVEYVNSEDDEGPLHSVVVDIAFLRLIFQWE
jgi:hypothetical protein